MNNQRIQVATARHAELKAHCRRHRITMSRFVERLIVRAIESQAPRGGPTPPEAPTQQQEVQP